MRNVHFRLPSALQKHRVLDTPTRSHTRYMRLFLPMFDVQAGNPKRNILQPYLLRLGLHTGESIYHGIALNPGFVSDHRLLSSMSSSFCSCFCGCDCLCG